MVSEVSANLDEEKSVDSEPKVIKREENISSESLIDLMKLFVDEPAEKWILLNKAIKYTKFSCLSITPINMFILALTYRRICQGKNFIFKN